jgi:MazG family protein
MHNIEELLRVMSALRDPESGCPWDLKQDFASIVPHTLEEAYEVAETIESGDFDELKLELGDLLFQVVFYTQLAREADLFTFEDVVTGITDKIINRHPHVFEDTVYADVHEQSRAWELLKAQEKQARGIETSGTLDGVGRSLPALSRAAKVQARAARVGFDWESTAQVVPKLAEEVDELRFSIETGSEPEHQAEELGDLLFSCVNLARHLKLDPEQTLRQATRKFEHRFTQVEKLAQAQGRSLVDCNLDELEGFWDLAKKEEGS